MQLLLMALVLGIYLHDQFGPAPPLCGGWATAATILVPKLIVAGLYWGLCRWVARSLSSSKASAALRTADYGTSMLRLAAAGLYAGDLALGGLTRLRTALGVTLDPSRHGPLLICELAIIAPTLALLTFSWWAYYPIDRRLRTATILSRIDTGLPVMPLWTRWQYVTAQLRQNAGLILAPLILIMAWSQIVDQSWFDSLAGQRDWVRPVLTVAGALTVFLLAPFIIRSIWDTIPLPEGPLRRQLVDLCRHHRVGVRELLLWRTFGGTVNGAVMGLIAPVRYILLTDALLDLMPVKQIQAVMAHELAHVRKHHIFWLMVSGFGSVTLLAAISLTGTSYLLNGLARVASTFHPAMERPGNTSTMVVGTGIACVCWLGVFGWVSRRFERQADSFAVQHLAVEAAALRQETGPVTIDADSALVMAEALQSVADLNHMSATRFRWRHGSIRWRQDYLYGLVGQPANNLPIDRLVRRIKVAALIAALAAIALLIFASSVPSL